MIAMIAMMSYPKIEKQKRLMFGIISCVFQFEIVVNRYCADSNPSDPRTKHENPS